MSRGVDNDVCDIRNKLAQEPVSRYYTAHMRARVGIDLVCLSDVAHALDAFGERYLQRIFTDRERAYCCDTWTPARTTPPRRVTERLAARFAGKEAVFKLLRSPGGLGYRDVEVIDAVVLSGAAAQLARTRRLGPIDISLTHEGTYAAACVTALEAE